MRGGPCVLAVYAYYMTKVSLSNIFLFPISGNMQNKIRHHAVRERERERDILKVTSDIFICAL